MSSMLWLSLYTIWFPQADYVLALLITAVFSTFIGAMYALFVVVMPRSGSDYVFTSRTLTPAIGLAFSVNLVFWLMMINAWNVYLTFAWFSQSIWSIGAMLGSTGALAVWQSIAGTTTGTLVLGIIIYVICTLLISFGMKRYMKTFQLLLNILFFVSFAIIIGAVLLYSKQDFISHYNAIYGPLAGSSDPYHDLLNLAQSAGYTAPTGFDWNQTITVSVLWWFISLWPMSSAWLGGEIKESSSIKSQFLAMSGGQWFTLLSCALLVQFWLSRFGKDWLGAIGYLAANGKIPTYLTGAGPTYWQLPWVNVLINNVPLAAITSIAWILQGVAVTTPLIAACSRHLFAWSFDRVVPAKLSEVSERFSSPMFSVTIIGIITLIGYVFTVYTSFLNFSVGGPVGVMWSMIILSVATLIFSRRRKETYQASTVSKAKFAGIPLMPLMGGLSLATVIMMLYYYLGPLNQQIIGGYATWVTEATAVIFVIAIAGYYVSKTLQAKRDVDLNMVFGQIPPE